MSAGTPARTSRVGPPKLHELKTDPAVFQAVIDGRKTWEIRRDDRGFYVGDLLWLRETRYTGAEMRAGAPLEYTGRNLDARVTYLLRGPVYGLQDGWVILSIRPIPGTGAATGEVGE